MRRLTTISLLLLAACATSGAEAALELGVRGLPAAIEIELRAARDRLQADPLSASTWCDLGEAWESFARRSFEPEAVLRARSSFVRARALGGDEELRARLGEIEIALFRERREEALALAEEACARFPGDSRFESARIVAWIANGRLDAASMELEALEAGERATDADRARVELAHGRIEAAQQHLARCSGPDSLVTARLRASVAAALAFSGRAQDALLLVESASARSDPARLELELARARIELLVATRERDERHSRSALARCEELRAKGACPRALVLAALALAQLGRDEEAGWRAREAEAALRRVVKSGERHAHALLAELLVEHDGDLDEALELARVAARGAPTLELRALVERIELLRAQR